MDMMLRMRPGRSTFHGEKECHDIIYMTRYSTFAGHGDVNSVFVYLIEVRPKYSVGYMFI